MSGTCNGSGCWTSLRVHRSNDAELIAKTGFRSRDLLAFQWLGLTLVSLQVSPSRKRLVLRREDWETFLRTTRGEIRPPRSYRLRKTETADAASADR